MHDSTNNTPDHTSRETHLPTWRDEIDLHKEVVIQFHRLELEGVCTYELLVSYPESQSIKSVLSLPSSYYMSLIREMVDALKQKKGYQGSAFRPDPQERYSGMVEPYIVPHVAHRRGDRGFALRPTRHSIIPFYWTMTFEARFGGDLGERAILGIIRSVLSVLDLPLTEAMKQDIRDATRDTDENILFDRKWQA